VSELVLRGIFLLRRKEIEWFYQRGASLLFPDAWEGFLAPIPEAERGDLLRAYHRRLTSEDPQARAEAARAWSAWEAATSKLIPDAGLIERNAATDFALAFARIECHYFVHGGFFERDGQLLEGIDRIRSIPAVIVQGRYDVVCPMESAWELHRAWPEAELRIVPDAGHSAFEPGIVHELVSATDRFAGRCSSRGSADMETTRENLVAALTPICRTVASLDLSDPAGAERALEAAIAPEAR